MKIPKSEPSTSTSQATSSAEDPSQQPEKNVAKVTSGATESLLTNTAGASGHNKTPGGVEKNTDQSSHSVMSIVAKYEGLSRSSDQKKEESVRSTQHQSTNISQKSIPENRSIEKPPLPPKPSSEKIKKHEETRGVGKNIIKKPELLPKPSKEKIQAFDAEKKAKNTIPQSSSALPEADDHSAPSGIFHAIRVVVIEEMPTDSQAPLSPSGSQKSIIFGSSNNPEIASKDELNTLNKPRFQNEKADYLPDTATADAVTSTNLNDTEQPSAQADDLVSVESNASEQATEIEQDTSKNLEPRTDSFLENFQPVFPLSPTIDLNAIEANSMSVKTAEWSDETGRHVHYYVNDTFIGEITPDTRKIKNGKSGAVKKIVEMNDHHVFLALKTPRRLADEMKEFVKHRNERFAALSSKLSATCLTYALSDDKARKLVSPNAKSDLHSFLTNNADSVISLTSFRDAANDLSVLHANNITSLDIKPENLGFNDEKILLLDSDDFVLSPLIKSDISMLNKATIYPANTPAYFPGNMAGDISGTYSNIPSADTDDIMRARIVVDNFQFLLAMMEGTQNDAFIAKKDSQDRDLREKGLRNERVNYYVEENGIMKEEQETQTEMERAKEWVDQCVKDEYKESVLQLLVDPKKYLSELRKNKIPSVIEIIDWDATLQE